MLTFEGASEELDGYLTRPKFQDERKRPAIIVIHEILGLTDHIKDVADRFASQGYVAFAPNLFSSRDLRGEFTPQKVGQYFGFMRGLPTNKMRDMDYVSQELAKVPDAQMREQLQKTMQVFRSLPRERFVEDLVGAVNFLEEKDYVRHGKIGSVGFCFGGGMSIALACKGRTAACVIFYGENPSPIEGVKNIAGPILGLYGGDDERINSNLDALVKAMTQYKKDFEMKIYPGAPHAFFNDTSKQTYREGAAKDAWERVLRFFSRSLS